MPCPLSVWVGYGSIERVIMHRQVTVILRQAVQIIAQYHPLHEASVKGVWTPTGDAFIYNGVGFLIDMASLNVDIHGCGLHGGVSATIPQATITDKPSRPLAICTETMVDVLTGPSVPGGDRPRLISKREILGT